MVASTGGGETVGDTLKREYLPPTDATAPSCHVIPKSGIYTDVYAPSCVGTASSRCGCPVMKEEPQRWLDLEVGEHRAILTMGEKVAFRTTHCRFAPEFGIFPASLVNPET